MFTKHFKRVMLTVSLIVASTVGGFYACSDTPTVSQNPVQAPLDSDFGFAVLNTTTTLTDTILTIRVNWKAPNDPFGAPDFYRHTMVASKTVTDASTGPLPSLKQVNGLVDTVRIKINYVNDTVTLTSSVWSVRRGLQSTTPATGKLFVRRGDKAPLPPDSIKVDTIVVPGAPIIGAGLVKLKSSPELVKNNETAFNSLFKTMNDGSQIYKVGNTTYLTIVY